VLYLELAAAPVPREWAASADEVRLQVGADLGQRLAAAFAQMLGRPGDRALVIGADSPDLPPALLQEGAVALARSDLVLGPAHDGGYYLVALARPAPELFTDMAWGTGVVHQATLERARALGLRVHALAPWWDVDEPADLAALVGRLLAPGGRERAPATSDALGEIGLLPRRRA
jgi:rSAM/selenodomain-associated transferase 1